MFLYYYHIDRKQAEIMLKTCPKKTFLIRPSTRLSCHALSKHLDEGIEHYLIENQNGKFISDDRSDDIFNSLDELAQALSAEGYNSVSFYDSPGQSIPVTKQPKIYEKPISEKDKSNSTFDSLDELAQAHSASRFNLFFQYSSKQRISDTVNSTVYDSLTNNDRNTIVTFLQSVHNPLKVFNLERKIKGWQVDESRILFWGPSLNYRCISDEPLIGKKVQDQLKNIGASLSKSKILVNKEFTDSFACNIKMLETGKFGAVYMLDETFLFLKQLLKIARKFNFYNGNVHSLLDISIFYIKEKLDNEPDSLNLGVLPEVLQESIRDFKW